jgi:hypothetical protein
MELTSLFLFCNIERVSGKFQYSFPHQQRASDVASMPLGSFQTSRRGVQAIGTRHRQIASPSRSSPTGEITHEEPSHPFI